MSRSRTTSPWARKQYLQILKIIVHGRVTPYRPCSFPHDQFRNTRKSFVMRMLSSNNYQLLSWKFNAVVNSFLHRPLAYPKGALFFLVIRRRTGMTQHPVSLRWTWHLIFCWPFHGIVGKSVLLFNTAVRRGVACEDDLLVPGIRANPDVGVLRCSRLRQQWVNRKSNLYL